MEYDFEDPNFDFAGNAEIIAAKLRKAREMQNAEAPQGVSAPGVFAMSRPDIGGAIQRGVGRYEQAQAEQARGTMNTEQLRRYDELSRGLNEMKPIDYSNPDEAVLENSRKQALAAQMAKLNLPQAQKAAEIYLNKGAAFPETIAKMKMEQIERGEQNALKLAEIADQKRRDEEFKRWQVAQQDDTKRFVAGLTASSRENKPDMRFVDTVDENGNPVKQVVDMSTVKPGDVFGKPSKTPKGGDPTKNAAEVLEILKQADPLIGGSTASGLGNLVDTGMGFFGKSTGGADKAAQLRSLGGILVSKMPRMEGPQSDKDVALYKEMAGRIGDPNVPTSQKRAAAETIRELNSRYAGVEYTPGGSTSSSPDVVGAPSVTKTYGGVTYVKKPGTTGKNKSDWVPQ